MAGYFHTSGKFCHPAWRRNSVYRNCIAAVVGQSPPVRQAARPFRTQEISPSFHTPPEGKPSRGRRSQKEKRQRTGGWKKRLPGWQRNSPESVFLFYSQICTAPSGVDSLPGGRQYGYVREAGRTGGGGSGGAPGRRPWEREGKFSESLLCHGDETCFPGGPSRQGSAQGSSECPAQPASGEFSLPLPRSSVRSDPLPPPPVRPASLT